MTIASEITRIKNNIASAYTALSNKGATLPVTQDSANLASCVNSITSDVNTSIFYSTSTFYMSMGTIIGNSTGTIDTNYNLTLTTAQWQKELIIQLHIKTPASFNEQNQWIMGTNTGSWNTGVALTINKDIGNRFWFMLGQTNTSLSEYFEGVTVPQTDTEYWIRVYKPNSEFFAVDTLFQISTDGINWTTEASKTIANISSDYTTTGNVRLFNGYFGDIYNHFYGDIYLNDTFISVDGEKIWYLVGVE